DCGATGDGRRTFQTDPTVVDRERFVGRARRRRRAVLRASVLARASRLSAEGKPGDARSLARWARARIHAGGFHPDRAVVRPGARVAGDAARSDGVTERP